MDTQFLAKRLTEGNHDPGNVGPGNHRLGAGVCGDGGLGGDAAADGTVPAAIILLAALVGVACVSFGGGWWIAHALAWALGWV